MLRRRLRLNRADFALLRPQRAATPHFLVSAAPAPRGGCAVVVPKKVERTSVGRHLLKRRVLSVLRPYCGAGAAIIVSAKRGSAGLPFGILKAELLEALGHLRIA